MQTTFSPAIAKPLSFGISQWISGLFSAQQGAVTAQDARVDNRVDNIRALQRMARELEFSQPNLAAELRNFATRS